MGALVSCERLECVRARAALAICTKEPIFSAETLCKIIT